MNGVSATVAAETFRDIQAAPSFIPLLLSVDMVRGETSQVGACWLERRQVGNVEVVVRQTITKRSDDPFMQSAVTELVVTNSCTMPDFLSTYTLVIEPSSSAKDDCTAHWTDAIISRGMLGRLLSIFCVPCLKRQWTDHTQAEWQYYYEEALRRTSKAEQTPDGSNKEKTGLEHEQKQAQG